MVLFWHQCINDAAPIRGWSNIFLGPSVISLHFTKICFITQAGCSIISQEFNIVYSSLRYTNPVALQPYRILADRAAAAVQRSLCQLLRLEGCHVVSATDPHGR